MVMIQQTPGMNAQLPMKRKVQFSGNNQPQFSGVGDILKRLGPSGAGGGGGSNPTRKYVKIGAGIGAALLTAIGLSSSYQRNMPTTVSVVSRFVEGSERNPDGSIHVRGEGGLWLMPFGLDRNYRYSRAAVEVRDTINPHSRDGVVINGDGTPTAGVDLRVGYRPYAGELYPDRYPEIDPATGQRHPQAGQPHPQAGQPIDPKILEHSIGIIHSELVGSSRYNSNFTRETGVATPSATADPNNLRGNAVEFKSGTPEMQNIYFSLILPKIQLAVKMLSTNIRAEDIHTQRQFISEGLQNGYTQYRLNPDGSRALDAEGKPIVDFQLPSLHEMLRPLGIEVLFAEAVDIDTPSALWDPINKIGQIPQEITNLRAMRTQYEAQQLSAREAVRIRNNRLLEETRGRLGAQIASKRGERDQATQNALAREQEAIMLRNQRLAAASGTARELVSNAQREAITVVQAATGRRDARLIEAAGEAERILVTGRAEAERLAMRGGAYSNFPQMYEQLQMTTNAEIQAAIAARFNFMILTPDKSVEGVLARIGEREVRLVPQAQQR